MKISKRVSVALLVGTAAAAGTATISLAGADATFAAALTMLTDWLEGSLGKILALTALVVGLAMGISQQSVFAVVIGVAFALAFVNGPAVLNGMFTAGIPS